MDDIAKLYTLSIFPDSLYNSIDSFYEDILQEHQQIILEATGPVVKKNIISKIGELLKKMSGLLEKTVDIVKRFFKEAFIQSSHSADKLLEKLNIKPENTNVRALDIPSIDKNNSSLNIEDVTIINRPFRLTFEKDNIIISSWDVISNSFSKGYHPPVTGRYENYWSPVIGLHTLVFNFLDNSKFDNDLIAISKELATNGILSENGQAALDRILHVKRISLKNFKVSFNRIQEFQKVINTLHDNLQRYDVPKSGMFDQNLKRINAFAQICNNLQFGFNAIAESMRGIYVIDAKYANSIHSVKKLAEFAEELINDAIPAKYIALNILLVADESLKGEKANPTKPILGQTRTVLFPPDKDYVLKIAVSKMGARANESENKIYNKVKNTSAKSMFAAVRSITPNKCISMMEKISDPRIPSVFELSSFRHKLTKICEEQDIPINLNKDMHFANVRFRENGKLCTIDYGMGKRIKS